MRRRAVRIVILGILTAVFAVVVVRTLTLDEEAPLPAAGAAAPAGGALDEMTIARRLARAVQFPTISHQDPGQDDLGALAGLRAYLAQTFPDTFLGFHPEVVGGGSLLMTWTGTDPALKPVLLLSHMDVVPISPGTEKDWIHPPFSGDIDGGYIWGRGSLDDKGGVVGILEAASRLLAQGFRPARTLIFAFGHDEEVGGRHGAAEVAKLLAARGVRAEFVLDEGGLVGVGLIDGVPRDVSMIGVAEKGYMSVELSVDAAGGHASQPPPVTAIGRLSRAIANLEAHPMPLAMSGALKDMLITLAPEMSFGRRLAIANLWLFEPLLRRALSGSDAGRASLGTTLAATIFQSGDKDNVLPARARAVVNLRLLPGDSAAAVLAHMREVIDDPSVAVAPIPGYHEASPRSDPRTPQFRQVAAAAQASFPDAVPAPFLTIGGTDSVHYEPLSPNIYRFLPAHFHREDLARFHGTNERLALADYAATVRFYERLMRDAAGGDGVR